MTGLTTKDGAYHEGHEEHEGLRKKTPTVSSVDGICPAVFVIFVPFVVFQSILKL